MGRKHRKFTIDELQELAEREDFGEILTSLGVPDIPASKPSAPKKWGEGIPFDRATFDYEQYERDFFKK